MTDAAMISVVAQICTTAAAIAAGYFAYRAKATSVETHKSVNSRMDKFMEMAKASFRAEGVLQEKQDEAVRKADKSAESESVEGGKPLAQAIKEVPKKTAVEVVKRLEDLNP